MADLPCPKMDWEYSDRTQALEEFKQLATAWFQIKGIEAKDQHRYIMLWIGHEGLRILNTFNLTAEQLKEPKNIWDNFERVLKPAVNIRIARLSQL